nr:hypothetical protein [Tanacetum cinerariifolium]
PFSSSKLVPSFNSIRQIFHLVGETTPVGYFEGEDDAGEDKDGDERDDDEKNQEVAKYDEQDDAEGDGDDEEEGESDEEDW